MAKWEGIKRLTYNPYKGHNRYMESFWVIVVVGVIGMGIYGWFATKDEPIAVKSTTPKTESERKNLLNNHIARVFSYSRDAQTLLHTDFAATIKFGKPINHILHLLLCIPTFGFWLIVWIFIGITHKEKTRMYTVDDFGNIKISR